MEIVTCKSCGSKPNKSVYKTDAGGYTSNSAKIECGCGVSVTKFSSDFRYQFRPGMSGWDMAHEQWISAMISAIQHWNRMNA